MTRTIIITGCSSGIGNSLALKLANSDTNLVLAARNMDALKKLEIKCQANGAKTLVQKTDISKEAECKSLIDETVSTFGGIDILVNNAGISMKCNFEDIETLDMFKSLMEVNYLGTVYCTYYALKHLKKSKGLIASVSSLQGKTGFPGSTGYAASKYAMQGFLDSLRVELSSSGVDVLIIYPGPVDTDIHNKKFTKDGSYKQGDKDFKNKGLMGQEECSNLIVKAIKNRDRELVMTLGGKLMPWMKLLSPKLLDHLLTKFVNKFYE